MTDSPLIIPHKRLSDQALRGLIEEFVTRHGTDGGWEASLDDNVAMVMGQLDRGEAFVAYDEASQTANIVPKEKVSP